jgi:hypothetical protein
MHEISHHIAEPNVIVIGKNERVTVNRTVDRQTGVQVGNELCKL